MTFVLCLLNGYENQQLVKTEVIGTDDPEVREAALVAAQEMGSANVKYELDEITKAKIVYGFDIKYEMRVVLSDKRKCLKEETINCKVRL
jgi:hypothetical protein